jgi:guanylate kinase
MGDLEQRLIARDANTAEEIANRLRIANDELQARDDFQHVIVNDDVDRAASQLIELIRSALSEETE